MSEILDIINANKSFDYRVVKKSPKCVVLESDSYYYKIHQIEAENPIQFFEMIVIETFAEEFRRIGLDWEVFREQFGGVQVLTEKRQKLELLSEEKIEFSDAMKKVSEITVSVEKKLGLPLLTAQIRQNGKFQNVKNVVLARDCEETVDDFAIFGDDVIPLGNSNLFLALVGFSGNWERFNFSTVEEVALPRGDFYFANQNIFKEVDQAISSVFEVTPKWWLFPLSAGNVIETTDRLRDELKEMLRTNSKILATKKKITVKEQSQFGNMSQECRGFLGENNDN